MSAILDALKRQEEERRRGQAATEAPRSAFWPSSLGRGIPPWVRALPSR